MLPTSYAWVLNLDAELELATPCYNPPARLTEQLQKFVTKASALLGPRDVLLDQLQPARSASCLGRAWCPTPQAVAAMRAAGLTPEPHPHVSVLRKVNHRAFAHGLGRGLPQQTLVSEAAALAEILSDTSCPWLLKRPLAFAGRGQQRVFGVVDENIRKWIAASLRADSLIVEPLICPLMEFSLHGFVWPDGRQQWGRICVQAISERGVYRDIRLADADELTSNEQAALHEAARATSEALYRAGYFGPFGIDSYRYRAHSGMHEGFCALSEINARYTMGFVTGFPVHPTYLHLAPDNGKA